MAQAILMRILTIGAGMLPTIQRVGSRRGTIEKEHLLTFEGPRLPSTGYLYCKVLASGANTGQH